MQKGERHKTFVIAYSSHSQRVMYDPKLYETLVKQSIVCHCGGRKLQKGWINCCNN